MARQASDEYKVWREIVLASPWVKEVTGDVRCSAPAGYVPVRDRGDLQKALEYRCEKKAKFRLKAAVTRSMLTIDAVSGNYCPYHFKQAVDTHEGERDRFERWFARYE